MVLGTSLWKQYFNSFIKLVEFFKKHLKERKPNNDYTITFPTYT